ncbi:kinesin-like protein [Moniliophthora roreri]|nr:kinesin-like protein [Moniliophthora roreri]
MQTLSSELARPSCSRSISIEVRILDSKSANIDLLTAQGSFYLMNSTGTEANLSLVQHCLEKLAALAEATLYSIQSHSPSPASSRRYIHTPCSEHTHRLKDSFLPKHSSPNSTHSDLRNGIDSESLLCPFRTQDANPRISI